jgi:hypothetical protein
MLPLDKPAESANELRAAAGQEIPFTVDLLEICAQTLSAVVIGSGPRALLHQNDVADRSRNRIPCVAVRSGLPRPVFDSASGRPAGQRTSSFSVVANALVSICAFASVVVFFKTRRRARSPAARDGSAEVSTATLPAAHVQAPPLAPSDAVDIAEQGHARLGV